MTAPSYYAGKTEVLRDLFGARAVETAPGGILVDGRFLPVVDDVIVLLPPARLPEGMRAALPGPPAEGDPAAGFAPDIQFTFGEEWRRFPAILPEHEEEFGRYFDLVDLGSLKEARVCDLGCGIGRWSRFLAGRCRELVLVDFSEAIFVARKNLADAGNALFFMGDIADLPFRDDFADFVFCLGVLHHLPTPALDGVRALRRCAPTLLVFLYYALDNRPAFWRPVLSAVTAMRRLLSRVRSPAARGALTWLLAAGVYLPLLGLGTLLAPLGLARRVPLYEAYAGCSVRRIRQDVYDRFFTSIEQRVRRDEILSLRGTFREVVVSDGMPYWHFLCRR